MKKLITGAAGFIGYHLADKFCSQNYEVVGVDNLNSYYDTSLKESRLRNLQKYGNFRFVKLDLTDKSALKKLFDEEKFSGVMHLAAQPGVRYSITNPEASIRNNVDAFFNLLECLKESPANLIYASSSSVYGNNKKIPFSVNDPVDHPISLYAATKKSNELMAYTYHHLYKIPATGLRFFTVYGPYGRPDMAYFKFAMNIMNDKPIDVYNNGDMQRDFTYIDDVTESISRLAEIQSGDYKILNIGGEHPVNLLSFIETLENLLGKKAIKIFKEMQPGDVKITYADSSELESITNYKPEIRIDEGLKEFVKWFKEYYNFD